MQFKNIIKRIVICTAAIFLAIPILLLSFLLISPYIYPAAWGSYSLEDGFYIMDFDGGPIIVKGTNISGNTCYGGSLIIPPYEFQFDSLGNFNEHVEDVKFDKEWIISKTYSRKDSCNYYYILNKRQYDVWWQNNDSKLDKGLLRFKDSLDFADNCNNNSINLYFE